jgi:hypothetical protein
MPHDVHILALKLIRNLCIGSEENREHISWELSLLEPLISLIRRDKLTSLFIREVGF